MMSAGPFGFLPTILQLYCINIQERISFPHVSLMIAASLLDIMIFTIIIYYHLSLQIRLLKCALQYATLQITQETIQDRPFESGLPSREDKNCNGNHLIL